MREISTTSTPMPSIMRCSGILFLDDQYQVFDVVDLVVRMGLHCSERITVPCENSLHADVCRTDHIALSPIADHERLVRFHAEELQCFPERSFVRLSL